MSSFNPDLDTPEGAEKATRTAAIAATISGVLTTLFSVYAMTRGSLALEGLASAWSLIDAVLLFGLAFGVYKANRGAAWALVLYWVFNFVIRLATTGIAGLGLNIVFGIFYGNGLRGANALHRMRQDAEMEEQLSIFENDASEPHSV